MSRKLEIELDGGQHAERHAYDETRDDYLRGRVLETLCVPEGSF